MKLATPMYLRPLYITLCCLALAFAVLPFSAHAAEESEGGDGDVLSHSGLPIPRFVSLKYEEVNLRTGPGRRYPIRWVYKRKYMPMEVVEEFGHWRKLQDVEGDEGWAHKSQISGARIAILKENSVLYRYPEPDAPPMIKAQKSVTGQLLECDLNWCEIQIESYKSWIEKKFIWGVYPREVL